MAPRYSLPSGSNLRQRLQLLHFMPPIPSYLAGLQKPITVVFNLGLFFFVFVCPQRQTLTHGGSPASHRLKPFDDNAGTSGLGQFSLPQFAISNLVLDSLTSLLLHAASLRSS
jgi:hypothetical protein